MSKKECGKHFSSKHNVTTMCFSISSSSLTSITVTRMELKKKQNLIIATCTWSGNIVYNATQEAVAQAHDNHVI